MPIQYATPAELSVMNLPAGALEGISDPSINAMLRANSALIQSYMRGRYRLPVSGALPTLLDPTNTFPPELVQACLAITAYDVLCFRGFNPDQYDANFKMRRDFYLGNEGRGTKGWLDKLAAGSVSIAAAVDASPLTYEGAAVVVGGSDRGWGDDGTITQLGELESSFWRREY